MTNNTVNETERMVVTRVFDAPRELVWKAVRGGEKRHHFRRDRAEPVAPGGWPIGGDRYGLYISF